MSNVILPNLGIKLPDIGSNQDTWGNILNDDLNILDTAVQFDVISKTLSNVDVTLTAAEAASAVINLTGTLTANVNVIVPATPVRVYLVRNQTSGAFTVTVKTAAGTGTPVQQGTSSLVYSDGTNIIQGATSVNGSFSAGNTSVANLSYTGTLTGGTGVVNIGSGQLVKDTAGNLGLGVTPSALWGVTQRVFDIAGASEGHVVAQVNSLNFGTNYLINSGGNAVYQNNGFAARNQFSFSDGGIRWFTAPSGTAGNPITFTQALTLFNSGGLSLGNTTDPGARNLSVTGSVTAASFSGAGTGLTGTASGLSIGGNATTATTLQTARTINGVSFNGSANISINLNNSLTAGNGLTGTAFNGGAASTFALGTPSSISNTSTDSVTATSHTHALIGELVETTAGSPAYYGARAFVNFNGTGTVAIRNSQGVSSITDNDIGAYTVNLSVAMPDVNYTVVSSAGAQGSASTITSLFKDQAGNLSAPLTTSFRLITSFDSGAGQRLDNEHVCVSVFR